MTFKASETFWRHFYALSASQKQSVRDVWEIFKRDPFAPSLRTHKIHSLSAALGRTVYAVVIESNLRILFYLDGEAVRTIDIGTHDVYRV